MQLAKLEKEQLARITFRRGKLVSRLQVEEHTSLGKPVPAKIYRVFRFRNGEDAREAQLRALVAARATGWQVNRRKDELPNWLYGAKAGMTLYIHRFEEDRVHKLSLSLFSIACPEALCSEAQQDHRSHGGVAAALIASATATAARISTAASDPKRLVLPVSDLPR
jgi:hypothetical protein